MVKKKKPKERRKSARTQILADVTFVCEDQTHNGQMLNASGGGAFIETRKLPEVGSVIEIKSSFPGMDHTSNVFGRVLWTRAAGDSDGPAGVGVEFVEEGS